MLCIHLYYTYISYVSLPLTYLSNWLELNPFVSPFSLYAYGLNGTIELTDGRCLKRPAPESMCLFCFYLYDLPLIFIKLCFYSSASK